MENIERPRNQERSHGAGRARRFTRVVSLNDLAIVLLLFVEPISSMLASFFDLGRHCFDSFMHWIKRSREQAGGKVALCNRRVMSRDLKSVQFLKRGFSGFIYETTWSTWYGMERSGRYARKDFPGVDSKVFEDEAARLVNLDHPNVVKTYCWTVDKVGCSLVMEFVNDDLASVVRKRKAVIKRRSVQSQDSEIDVVAPNSPFKLVEAMYIIWHIASAMDYLHSMEVAHGDLRPNNVMVDLDPGRMIVKVVDFGLIESKKRTTLVSKRAKFLQILEWKAPELCKELVDFLHVTSDEYPWTYPLDIIRQETIGGHSPNHSEVGGIMQRWVENIQQMGTYNTNYPTGMHMSASRTIPVDENFPPMKNVELPICKNAELPPSPSTKPPPRPSLEPRVTSELALSKNPNSSLARLSREPSPSKSHRSPTVRLNLERVHNTRPHRKERLPKRGSRFSSSRFSSRQLARTTCTPHRKHPGRLSRRTCISHGKNPRRKSIYLTRQVSELVQSECLEHAMSLVVTTIQSTREISLAIHCTKSHWSIPIFPGFEPGDFLEKLQIENVETFAVLKETYGEFFRDNMDEIGLCIGEKFAEGGQAEIFTARWLDQKDEIVLKVFKLGTSIRDLQCQMPMDALLLEARALKEGKGNPRLCHISGALMLNDGRFAFVMERYWGDLRELIDRRMKQNDEEVPPFTMVVAKHIMMEIAEGVQSLHDHHVVHRDVKASNIFIKPLGQPWDKFHPEEDAFSCIVGDFETSIGIGGTGYWRAPEILLAVLNHRFNEMKVKLITEKCDVYSFSMTCYEILTGGKPFHDVEKGYKRTMLDVLAGARPSLPSSIHPAVKSLLYKCWHQDPSKRPTFVEILDELRNITIIE